MVKISRSSAMIWLVPMGTDSFENDLMPSMQACTKRALKNDALWPWERGNGQLPVNQV